MKVYAVALLVLGVMFLFTGVGSVAGGLMIIYGIKYLIAEDKKVEKNRRISR